MIDDALKYYQINNPTVNLIRHNENMTYKITDANKSYVMRVHKPTEGFSLDLLCLGKDRKDLVADEIKILQHLAGFENVHAQNVKLNIYEKPVTILMDGTPVTVLEWIEGNTLEDIDVTAEIANKLGIMIGKLHNSLAQTKFENRYHYDRALITVMIEEASKASKQGHFNEFNANIIIETLSYIRDYLHCASSKFSLVHSDLSKSNLIYHKGVITPIDFSLSGYCIPEMDLASAFSHINNKALNQDILDGYKSICLFEPDDKGIEVCLSLQILLFIVIQHNKFASEEWFQDMIDNCCCEYFTPLKKQLDNIINL